MQQLLTTEDTESTEKCQRILIYWRRPGGSLLQSDGFSDFNFFVGFTEGANKDRRNYRFISTDPAGRPWHPLLLRNLHYVVAFTSVPSVVNYRCTTYLKLSPCLRERHLPSQVPLLPLAPNLLQNHEQAVNLRGHAGADADVIAQPRLVVIANDDALARQLIAQLRCDDAMHAIQHEI